MEDTLPAATSPSVQKIAVDVIYIAIADKVRTDVAELGKPIPVESLGALFPDMKPEEVVEHLGAMVKIEKYQDVHVYVSPCAAAYLYSDKSIAPEQAIEQVIAAETQEQIVSKVREESQKTFQLTAIDALPVLFPELEPERVYQYARATVGIEDCPDIKLITSPANVGYLYSDKFMTDNYAVLLARTVAKNPYITIAETVREESRVYPRPTKVAQFYDPFFQIDGEQMQTIVENLLQKQEYQDIKKIVASTGAIYLYSTKYLEPGAAQWQVQWEEVEKDNNP